MEVAFGHKGIRSHEERKKEKKGTRGNKKRMENKKGMGGNFPRRITLEVASSLLIAISSS